MENVEALFQHTARLIAMDKKGMTTVGSKAEGISIMGVIFPQTSPYPIYHLSRKSPVMSISSQYVKVEEPQVLVGLQYHKPFKPAPELQPLLCTETGRSRTCRSGTYDDDIVLQSYHSR